MEEFFLLDKIDNVIEKVFANNEKDARWVFSQMRQIEDKDIETLKEDDVIENSNDLVLERKTNG